MFFSLNIYGYLKYRLLSRGLNSTEKKFTTPFNPGFFFILLIVKFSETLPKHSA